MLQVYLRDVLISTAERPSVADVIARARLRVAATGSRVDARATLEALDADRR
jgi:hypothetical protein